MKQFILEETHPFYDHCSLFLAQLLGCGAYAKLREAQVTIGELVNTYNNAVDGILLQSEATVPDFPKLVFPGGMGSRFSQYCIEFSLDYRFTEFALGLSNDAVPITFDLITGSPETNTKQFEALELERITHPERSADDLVLQGAALAVGSAYELVKTQYALPKDPIFGLFRHLRNASFHGNKFNFFPQEIQRITVSATKPQWMDFEISDPQALHGQKAFGGFMPPYMIFPFLHDVGAALATLTPTS